MWICKNCGCEFIMIIEEKNRIGLLGIPSKTLSKEAIEIKCSECGEKITDFNLIENVAVWED
ncbi:hypothetical protein [Fusobacterium varium]|uniref:hypothetical protein n=1 Tax=Fusobacterium varium TaxID=856 RepID=UPI00304CF6F4